MQRKRAFPDDDTLYRLFLLRDPKNNGQFLTGVLTTGIYCLPSCPARRPLRENVRFFQTPEEAAGTGLRPCRRCHPDWFYRGEEWHEDIFERTATRVRSNPAAVADVTALAKAAGLSKTALHDLFRNHAQESPSAFLRHVRVHHACGLLAEGRKPLEAATGSGFGSSSTFHQQFALLTGMTPAAYSDLGREPGFTLRLPANYARRTVLGFHGRDPEGVCERVIGDTMTKCLDGGTLEIRLEDGSAECTWTELDGFTAHRIAVRMLGLGQDAEGFERQFRDDDLIGPIVQRQTGLRVPLSATPWEGLAWAITGQQIGLGFAISLRRRLIQLAGTPHTSGLVSHPSPAAVARLEVADLQNLQFSRSKAEYLLEAARRIASGDLDLDRLREASAKRAARLLSNLRGIGPWTVDYMFLRGLGFPDSLPSGDAGIAQGLERLTGARPSGKEIQTLAARFAPYRSLAAAHIWASLHPETQA